MTSWSDIEEAVNTALLSVDTMGEVMSTDAGDIVCIFSVAPRGTPGRWGYEASEYQPSPPRAWISTSDAASLSPGDTVTIRDVEYIISTPIDRADSNRARLTLRPK